MSERNEVESTELLGEWQPIETAPINHHEQFLVAYIYFDLEPKSSSCPVYWDEEKDTFIPMDGDAFLDDVIFTHWMPYPSPPNKGIQ